MPDSRTDEYFYTQLEESHKIAFWGVQFPNESVVAGNWSLASKCSILSECVINCLIIRMGYLTSVI